MSVVLLAAGSSARMGGVDKLDLEIGDKSVMWHSLEVFDECDSVECVVVVTQESKIETIRHDIESRRFSKRIEVVSGGERRQDSVRRGLDQIERISNGSEFVAVHDAARPFIDRQMLDRGLAVAQRVGAAIPVVPLTDTVKRIEHGIVSDTPDRSSLFAVQTPQIFRTEILIAAHETVTDDVTDDASMVEVAGGLVGTFEGDYRNIKLTTPSDIAIARAIALDDNNDSDQRYGIGFDGHKLVDGGPLKLGGLAIDFDMHLQGHSDGDVLMHAVASAILGAAGLGDLGGNFPSNDPRYAGVDSGSFVAEATEKAKSLGWHVDHLDATVIAQRPRLAQHVRQFESNIAGAAGAGTDRINVKITSTDEVGAIGAGEGIAAQAIATLRR